MPLTRVTITGADDEIDPGLLLDLSWDYPFVEWGILFGLPEKEGSPRYPSIDWIERILVDVEEGWADIGISAHLCFPWTRNLAENILDWDEIRLISNFNRVQINQSYHNVDKKYIEKLFLAIDNIGKSVIFQNNGTLPIDLINAYVGGATSKTTPQILFDCSGGRGIEIRNYPTPLVGFDCGYAGGIGPENIRQVIEELNAKFPHLNYWIDMETKVRTNDGENLDLDLVETCLKISEEYIK